MLTSLQRIATGVTRFWTLGVLLLLASDAWSITISPSPSPTGNYTVTFAWTGCYWEPTPYPYAYYVSYACRFLEEQSGAGSWAISPTASGATSLNVTGKAPGTYAYQVYKTRFYGDKQVIDGPVSVTVGTPPPRDPLLTQLNYQFQTRQGDINADGRTDLFVKRTAGGVAGNGVLDATILRQGTSGGLFTAVVPTPYESSIASSWPLSSTTTVVTDFNVDGFVDVEVKGIAAAMGLPAASDQIVFSSGVPLQAQPLGVRAVDVALKKFVGNMLDYIVNPHYFSDYADLALVYGTYPVYYCSFSWGTYSGILEEYDSGLSCGVYSVYVSGYYWDYSGFSSAAVGIWTNEESFHGGTITRNEALDAIERALEELLGVVLGGWDVEEVAGTGGPYSDLDYERGLDVFLAILGVANANAQEISTEEAPEPQVLPREANIIWVTGRYIFASSERGIHSALQYTLPGTIAPTWVSGFDSEAESVLDDGVLLAETNDPRDHPVLMQLTLGWVVPRSNGSRFAYWFNDLMPAHNRYRNLPNSQKAPYDSMPEWLCLGLCGHYNSNSYVEGLVEATSGQIVAKAPFLGDFSDLVGGGVPVPSSYFGL